MSMKFIIPGLFLLILGIGNIGVGTFKGVQYQEVLLELSTLQQLADEGETSALRRLQLDQENDARHYDRVETAKSRLEFYELVQFGGKAFASVSLIVILFGLLIRSAELIRPVPELDN